MNRLSKNRAVTSVDLTERTGAAYNRGIFIFGALLFYLATNRICQILIALFINAIGILLDKGFVLSELVNVVRPGLYASAVVPNAVQNFLSLLISATLTINLIRFILKLPLHEVAPCKKIAPVDGFCIIGALVGFSFIGTLIGQIIGNLFAYSRIIISFSTVDIPQGSAIAFILFSLTVVLIPAVFEELLVRGYILSALENYGHRFAIFISAAIFAAVHRGPDQIVSAFVFSVGAAYFMLLFKNVRWVIAGHLTVNCIALLSAVLQKILPSAGFEIYLYCCYGLIVAAMLASLVTLVIRHHYRMTHSGKAKITRRELSRLLLNPCALAFYAVFVFSIISGVTTR